MFQSLQCRFQHVPCKHHTWPKIRSGRRQRCQAVLWVSLNVTYNWIHYHTICYTVLSSRQEVYTPTSKNNIFTVINKSTIIITPLCVLIAILRSIKCVTRDVSSETNDLNQYVFGNSINSTLLNNILKHSAANYQLQSIMPKSMRQKEFKMSVTQWPGRNFFLSFKLLSCAFKTYSATFYCGEHGYSSSSDTPWNSYEYFPRDDSQNYNKCIHRPTPCLANAGLLKWFVSENVS